MSFLSTYPHLAARIFNVPLLVHPQKLDAIIAGLGQRLLGTQIIPTTADTAFLPPELFSTRKGPRAERGYQVIDGVAVLNVSGALVHKTRMQADSSTLLGYNSIAADLQDAMDQPDVHAVLQIWDSPGGEAQGAFQYADTARALRGKKPFIALADGMAASAGYLGASAANTLYITGTGYAGSIGVVMRHVDMSAALMSEGVRVTHIYAGSKKIDGNSFEPLSASVKADFQAEIDSLYTTFVAAVAQARSLNPEAIRATQAATYRGQDAITAGLADRIGTADALITELAAQRPRIFSIGQPARLSTADKGAFMSHTSTQEGGQLAAPTPAVRPELVEGPARRQELATMPTFTQTDLDAAVAAATTAATTQERARLCAIQGHPNASAQPGLVKLCIDTGISATQATALLAAAVSAAPAAATSPFTTAMAATPNPAVSGIESPANSADLDQEAQARSIAASILGAYRIKA
jgi:signal peptide peptidase SppA